MASKKDKKDSKGRTAADKRQEIVDQALQEIQFARTFKQGKIGNWKINEDMYYGRKVQGIEARANVDLGKMAAFVHTILSKIDNPLVFKFKKQKESQLKRVEMLNALRVRDQEEDNWDIKDIASKKQALIYGRAINSYFADSVDGEYKPHLNPVDVYDFLIDPSGGGIDLEKAFYMGDYGVVHTRKELEEMLDDKELDQGDRDAIKTLLEGDGNATEQTTEVTNQNNRTNDQRTTSTLKQISDPNKYVFWNWVTTFEGDRYYLKTTERGATAIEVCPLEEKFESGMWPYWSWAVFPDLTEFWTPSYCDYVREPFMAQAVSINQMLDNAEQINKPQRLVDVGAFEDLSQLKYRRNGVIEAKEGTDVNKAFQIVEVKSIDTPIKVYTLLDGISEKASGVTAAAQGDAENNADAKAAIYKGNQENSADRFGFLNKSYAFGYNRFAKLYQAGVKEHLVKKTAIEILGPNGVEALEISRRDIFRKKDKFGILVESSNAELALSQEEKAQQLAFLDKQAAIPNQQVQNPKKAYELSAKIAGFDEGTIVELMDTTNFGTAGTLSEAMRDIEMILDGEKVTPNEIADTNYQQRFVDYIQQNKEKIDEGQFNALMAYLEAISPIVIRNMTTRSNQHLMSQAMVQATAPVDPTKMQLNPLNGG